VTKAVAAESGVFDAADTKTHYWTWSWASFIHLQSSQT